MRGNVKIGESDVEVRTHRMETVALVGLVGAVLLAPVAVSSPAQAEQVGSSAVAGSGLRGVEPLGLRIGPPTYRTHAQAAATLLGARAAWAAAGLPVAALKSAANTATVTRTIIDRSNYRWNERTTARGLRHTVKASTYPDVATPIQVAVYDHGTKQSAAVHLPATFNAKYHYLGRTCGKAATWGSVGYVWSCVQPGDGGALVTRIAVARAGSAVVMAECAARAGSASSPAQLAAATRCAQRVVLAQQRASSRLFSTATDRVPMPRTRTFAWAMTECKWLPCQRVVDVGRWYPHVLVDAKRTSGLTVKRLTGTRVRVTITTRLDPAHTVYFSLRAKYFDAPAVNFGIRVGKAPARPQVSLNATGDRANNWVIFHWSVGGGIPVRWVSRSINDQTSVAVPLSGSWKALPAYDQQWKMTISLQDWWNRRIDVTRSFFRNAMLLYDAGPVVVASPGCVAGGRVLHVQLAGFTGQSAVQVFLYGPTGVPEPNTGRWYPVPTSGGEKGYFDGALLDFDGNPICRPPRWSGYVVDGSGTHSSPRITTKG